MIVSDSLSPLALITGGEGDLAKAIQKQLIAQGYQVLAPGKQALDVTSDESVKNYLKDIRPVDLLVCNAGITGDRLFLQMSAEDFANVESVNLSGAWRVARAVLKNMSQREKGHMVFIGSFAAGSGAIGQTAYAAAKAGLISLTQSLAREYGKKGIRANCVLPGFLETKMTQALSTQQQENFKAAHVLGRFNDTASVARFIAFLDQDLPHTSGQVFNLDSRIRRWT